MKHVAVAHVSSDVIDRVNRLLDIDSLEDLSDDELAELDAGIHSSERIFEVAFDDGSSLSFDLCSGSNNYYDDVVWFSADKRTTVVFEPGFGLDNVVEACVNDDVYIVEIAK